VGEGVAVGVGDGEGLGVGVAVGDGLGEGFGVGVGVALGLGVGIGVAVGDGVGCADCRLPASCWLPPHPPTTNTRLAAAHNTSARRENFILLSLFPESET